MRLFLGADIEKVVMSASLLQQRVVLLLIGGAGVVQDEKPDRVAVAPEMFVVLPNGFSDITKTVSGDNKKQVWILHVSSSSSVAEACYRDWHVSAVYRADFLARISIQVVVGRGYHKISFDSRHSR